MPPARPRGRTILIEPLNHHDAPGYFLNHTEMARRIIEAVGAPNLKLMFDCYHIQILEGDLTRRIDANLDITGHIQFAGVPVAWSARYGRGQLRAYLRASGRARI